MKFSDCHVLMEWRDRLQWVPLQNNRSVNAMNRVFLTEKRGSLDCDTAPSLRATWKNGISSLPRTAILLPSTRCAGAQPSNLL